MPIVPGLIIVVTVLTSRDRNLEAGFPLVVSKGITKILIIEVVVKIFTGVFTLFVLYHCLQSSFFLNPHKQRLSDVPIWDSIHIGLSLHYRNRVLCLGCFFTSNK